MRNENTVAAWRPRRNQPAADVAGAGCRGAMGENVGAADGVSSRREHEDGAGRSAGGAEEQSDSVSAAQAVHRLLCAVSEERTDSARTAGAGTPGVERGRRRATDADRTFRGTAG